MTERIVIGIVVLYMSEFLVALTRVNPASLAREWTPEQIPDPKYDTRNICYRNGTIKPSVCDPDRVVPVKGIESIQELIKSISGMYRTNELLIFSYLEYLTNITEQKTGEMDSRERIVEIILKDIILPSS